MASLEKAPAQVNMVGDNGSPLGTAETDAITQLAQADQGGVEMPAWKAYVRLWSYASPLDVLLRICGALAACAGGTAYPLMTVIFGNLVNDFNGLATGGSDPKKTEKQINRNALWLVYLFIGKFVVSSPCDLLDLSYTRVESGRDRLR